MSEPIYLEQVPPSKYSQAVELVCGFPGDPEAAGRAHLMLRLIRQRPAREVHAWWARQGRRALAAALILTSPGKAGMIFYSQPQPSLADVLARVLEATARGAVESGLVFVQALLEEGNPLEADIVSRAGFRRLAELIYMRRELMIDELAASPDESEYTWRAYGDFDDRELAGVISDTYQQSLDCPALAGAREMSDVIATHRSCGVFKPECWYILEHGGRQAACILVNDYPSNMVADVVYLGVTVPFRGRGISRLMLHRAGREALARGFPAMTLAVDSANPYALKVYEAESFVETGRRQAYAVLATKKTT